jgi:LysM repeat protein
VNPPLVDSIISFGKNYLNTRYRSGSSKDGEAGFDCSGFTSFVFSKFGYNLIHSSAAQAKQFPNIKKREIRPGDLVFYSGRGRRGGIGHVGFVTEVHDNGDFSFIHATNGAGVTVSKSDEAYYSRRYRTAARVLNFDSIPVTVDMNAFNSAPIKSVQPELANTSTQLTVKEPLYHQVKKGDTLYSLARQYNITVAELKSLNHLQDNLIKINQDLKIQ